jgi:hypothetical protein
MSSEFLNESTEELAQRLIEGRAGGSNKISSLEEMIIEDIIRLDNSVAEDKAKLKFFGFMALIVGLGAVIVSLIVGV